MNAVGTNGTINVREAVDSDKSAVERLLKKVNLPVESLASGATSFFLAEDKGALIGLAGFEFYGKDALLRSVAVQPELQGRGIGDRVVDAMILIARQRDINRIVLLTETAQKFFEKKGFRVVDRTSIDNQLMKQSSEFTFACPTSAVCMVLDLNVDAEIVSLSPREAFDACRTGAIILDVREEYVSQFKRFDIASVIQIPLTRLEGEVGRVPQGKMLIVADSSGLHSKDACLLLKQKGFSDISNLAGGFVEWERDGMPVVVDTSEKLSGSCACQLRARDKGDSTSL